jgi:lysophospholipase L1-like esterase
MPFRLVASCTLFLSCAALAAELKFDFGSGPAQPGFTQLALQAPYNATLGYGFLLPVAVSDAPVFAVDVQEADYEVTVRFGDPARSTLTTVTAESRRLMLKPVATAPGEFVTRAFTVNVRKPAIRGGGVTGLKDREKGPPPVPDWDERLTLAFHGPQAGVASLEIRPAQGAVTLFIAGDSTVTDQARGPYFGWGQLLPRFLRRGVSVSNQAESGLALFSFEGQRRLKKILSMMKPGDYLFIQFGHNDQKDKAKGAGPFTSYQANLKRFVAAAREKGGIPVLVTPMERRRWSDGKPQATLADYAEAVRRVGAEERVPVIDLHAMSLTLYAALGEDKSKQAFVFYPANTFPGQDKALEDNTHHSVYGGYELARCVVEGIRAKVPELAKQLADDASTFDPSKPDAPESADIPFVLVSGAAEKPAGN